VKAEAFTYDFHKKLDLSKLKKSLDYFNFLDGNKKVLSTEVVGLTVLVFEDGKMRVFGRGSSFDEIKEKMVTASVEIYSIVEDINKKLNLNLDPKLIISAGKREELYPTGEHLPMSSDVSAHVLRNLFFSIYEISGDFQAERIATRAGESIGREYVKKGNVNSKAELSSLLVKIFTDLKIGDLKEVKPEKRSVALESVFILYDSVFSAGIPNINKKVDNFARGLIRGAFAEFKGMESISVNEVKCWGMGDTYCQFEVYSLAK